MSKRKITKRENDGLRNENRKWFREKYYIDKDNMKHIKIPGDGNCAIHCIFLALLIENKINSEEFFQLSSHEQKVKIREYILYLRCHSYAALLKNLVDDERRAVWYSNIEITNIASMYDINLFLVDENNRLNDMWIGSNFDKEKPLFLYKFVNNNHFEFFILLEKFNKLNKKLKKFLEKYKSNIYIEIKNRDVLEYCSNIDEDMKIDDKKFDISNDIKIKIKDILGLPIEEKKKVKSKSKRNKSNKEKEDTIYVEVSDEQKQNINSEPERKVSKSKSGTVSKSESKEIVYTKKEYIDKIVMERLNTADKKKLKKMLETNKLAQQGIDNKYKTYLEEMKKK